MSYLDFDFHGCSTCSRSNLMTHLNLANNSYIARQNSGRPPALTNGHVHCTGIVDEKTGIKKSIFQICFSSRPLTGKYFNDNLLSRKILTFLIPGWRKEYLLFAERVNEGLNEHTCKCYFSAVYWDVYLAVCTTRQKCWYIFELSFWIRNELHVGIRRIRCTVVNRKLQRIRSLFLSIQLGVTRGCRVSTPCSLLRLLYIIACNC